MGYSKTYIVYEHVFPNRKRYIGITSTDVNSRWKNGNGYRHNSMMTRAIKKYGWSNIEHNVLYTNLTKEDAENTEIGLIRKYKSNDPEFGYNISNGGNSVGSHSERTKRQLSISQKGLHRSPATEFKKGRKSPMRGKRVSQEIRDIYAIVNKKHHGKKVKQYTLSGEFVREWDCLMDVQREMGLANSNISAVCLGKRKSLGGYIWKYE